MAARRARAERTESHEHYGQAETHDGLKPLAPSLVRDARSHSANGGDLLQMYADAQASRRQCQTRADDQLGSYTGYQHKVKRVAGDSLISHHTAATMAVLSPQISASTAKMIFMVKSQAIIDSVATLPARQCHGKARKRENAAMKATGANSGCMTAVGESKQKTPCPSRPF